MESGPPSAPSAGNTDSQASSSVFGTGALLDAADVAAVRVRADGTIAAATDAFASLTGFDCSELIGTPFSELTAADDPTLESLVDDAADAGPFSEQFSIRTNEGTTIAVDAHLEVRETDDGPQLAGVVTRRPTATESVSDSDLTYGRTFQALANALPDGIIILDTNSDVQYANPAVERILGHDPDELVGSSKVNIIPPRLRQAHLDALQNYLETGERNLNWTYVELPGQHKAGHEIPLGVSLNDFTYEGNRYFVGLFRDISPRKEAERTLKSKVAQLESIAYLGRHALEEGDADDLLEKATELISAALEVDCCVAFEYDAVGRGGSVADAGGSAQSDDVFRVREAVGCSEALLDSECARSTLTESLAGATLKSDDPIVVEDVAADEHFDAHLTDNDVRSGMGATVGSIAEPWGVLVVYDGESREFADHDVDFLESAATIIATALERQRYERQLGETVDELEASNERLEQFAYAASHDLQEPLRMVSSYLSLVENRYAADLDSEAEEFIAYAVDGADRMRQMIDGLLEYSRIDTQGEPFEPVDLEAVLEDVLTDLQMMIEESDAEITVDSLPRVRGDESQLRQLLQNLLSNAIEYSGDEPPRVEVTAQRCGRMWRFSVEDEGIGIDPDDADRIFRVFQRLHSREEYDGTGIGLALCRRIVERHGGEIWVESESGEGATFSFTLSRAEADV
ncbi:PAS domain-containing sensor histidine kinase [Haloterrigena salifodinae]|uniref:PAS domain-containing sensor histidine kinase n=1 Tax=Haloterrigena salifodinae TaxID=2675099 RepID=UPI000F876EC1|nr:ATP-binding protein [Haloterrigena salifodinae]